MAATTCIQGLQGTFYLEQAGFCFLFTNLMIGVLSGENAWTHGTIRHYVMHKKIVLLNLQVFLQALFRSLKDCKGGLLYWTAEVISHY